METKRVLITVKAYPNPSTKYVETVCCAGIDLKTNAWIRLFPIPFRDLDSNKRFKKYSIVDIDCRKANDDKRIESYKINADSINIIEQLDPKNKWAKRKIYISKATSTSLCDVLIDPDNILTSLTIIKPTEVDFTWEKAPKEDRDKREKCYSQKELFNKQKVTIEHIPYNFYYHFKCKDKPSCPSHKCLIIDWELGQSFRKWRETYRKEEILLDKIKERWLYKMCSKKNDTHFYIGNQHRFKTNFMVLGVYYPPV